MDRFHLFRKYSKTSLIFLTLAVIYVTQSIFYKPSHYLTANNHVSLLGGRVLSLSMLIISLITWFFSLLAYYSFRNYAESLRNSKDWDAHKSICTGLYWLAWISPIASILSEFITYVSTAHPGNVEVVAQLTTYATLTATLLSGIYLYIGSEKLTRQLKGLPRQPYTIAILAYLALMVIYVYALVLGTSHAQDATSSVLPSLYGPGWLLICTVVIPRVILWYLFLSAIMNFYVYRSRVNGIFYRSAFTNFARGLGLALGGGITLRIIQSLPTDQIGYGPKLLFVSTYLVLIIINVGLALIASGSNKLQVFEKL